MIDPLEARKQAILAEEEEYFKNLELTQQETEEPDVSTFVPTPELEEARVACTGSFTGYRRKCI